MQPNADDCRAEPDPIKNLRAGEYMLWDQDGEGGGAEQEPPG
jgi:hypothetical protein